MSNPTRSVQPWVPTHCDLVEALGLALSVLDCCQVPEDEVPVVAVARSVLFASLSNAPTRRLDGPLLVPASSVASTVVATDDD